MPFHALHFRIMGEYKIEAVHINKRSYYTPLKHMQNKYFNYSWASLQLVYVIKGDVITLYYGTKGIEKWVNCKLVNWINVLEVIRWPHCACFLSWNSWTGPNGSLFGFKQRTFLWPERAPSAVWAQHQTDSTFVLRHNIYPECALYWNYFVKQISNAVKMCF